MSRGKYPLKIKGLTAYRCKVHLIPIVIIAYSDNILNNENSKLFARMLLFL